MDLLYRRGKCTMCHVKYHMVAIRLITEQRLHIEFLTGIVT